MLLTEGIHIIEMKIKVDNLVVPRITQILVSCVLIFIFLSNIAAIKHKWHVKKGCNAQNGVS